MQKPLKSTFIVVISLIFFTACGVQSTPIEPELPAVTAEANLIEQTPTSTATSAQPSPTNTSVPSATSTSSPEPTHTPSNTPTSSPTLTATPTPTPTQTQTQTPTPTATNTPLPEATETPVPLSTATLTPAPTSTPTSEPTMISSLYPPIPEGKGLLFVINFHSDEAEFFFINGAGEYRIPGGAATPGGGNLALSLDPGYYRWGSRIQTLDSNGHNVTLMGEGEVEIIAGEIYGLGLTQDFAQPDRLLQGMALGSDPLTPAATPAPTPVPTPPNPTPGKVTVILNPGNFDGVAILDNQQYALVAQQWQFIEVMPGVYDVEFVYNKGFNCGDPTPCFRQSTNIFRAVQLPPDHICQITLEVERPFDNAAAYVVIGDWSGNVTCNPVQ